MSRRSSRAEARQPSWASCRARASWSGSRHLRGARRRGQHSGPYLRPSPGQHSAKPAPMTPRPPCPQRSAKNGRHSPNTGSWLRITRHGTGRSRCRGLLTTLLAMRPNVLRPSRGRTRSAGPCAPRRGEEKDWEITAAATAADPDVLGADLVGRHVGGGEAVAGEHTRALGNAEERRAQGHLRDMLALKKRRGCSRGKRRGAAGQGERRERKRGRVHFWRNFRPSRTPDRTRFCVPPPAGIQEFRRKCAPWRFDSLP